MNPVYIVAFIAFDLVVTAILLNVILRRRGAGIAFAGGTGLDAKSVTEIAKQVQQRTDEYMKSNWSGDPSTLPAAITGLLDVLQADLAQAGKTVDRAQLRFVVGLILRSGGPASAKDVREAMRQVA